jgi:tyrosyl-tRNA synthetase
VCVLKRLALAKKKVYAIAGGITGLIGDPKPSIERQMQEAKVINDNVKCISIQLQKYAKAQKVINNIDFYKNMSIASYLRDIGKLINVNYILEKEIISRRLEVGISYAEFSYTLLQGYDFLHLFETEKITCQAGGSDQ